MNYWIPVIAFVFLGVVFLTWGVYQLKTGKMIAGSSKNPTSNPRQLGLLFVYFGILSICLALNLYFNKLSNIASNFISTICFIVGMCGPIILIIIGIYGLIKKNVFGIKNTSKTRLKIKKYYKTIGISSIILGISVIIVIISVPLFGLFNFLGIIFAIVAVVSCATVATLTSVIESSVRKKP